MGKVFYSLLAFLVVTNAKDAARSKLNIGTAPITDCDEILATIEWNESGSACPNARDKSCQPRVDQQTLDLQAAYDETCVKEEPPIPEAMEEPPIPEAMEEPPIPEAMEDVPSFPDDDIECHSLNYAGEAKVNALVFDSFASNSDAQGRLIVCGDATMASYSASQFLGHSYLEEDNLIVGGDLSFKSGVLAGNGKVCGKADIGPSVSNFMSHKTSITEGVCDRYDCTTSYNYFTVLNKALCTLKKTGNVTLSETLTNTGNLEFRGSGEEEVEVYHLSVDLFNEGSYMERKSGGSVSLVNVYKGKNSSSTLLVQGGFHLGKKGRVLVNVCDDIETVTLWGASLTASILAPNSNILAKSGVVTGQVIANSFSGNVQLNLAEFDSCLDVDMDYTATAPAPAPAPAPDSEFMEFTKMFMNKF